MSIKLKSFLVNEQVGISDMQRLEKATKMFVEALIKSKIIKSHHQDLSASDVDVAQYKEDLAEVLRNEVIRWMDTVNQRAGR